VVHTEFTLLVNFVCAARQRRKRFLWARGQSSHGVHAFGELSALLPVVHAIMAWTTGGRADSSPKAWTPCELCPLAHKKRFLRWRAARTKFTKSANSVWTCCRGGEKNNS